MRVGLIEASHWHAGMYVDALLRLGEQIVAVSDRSEAAARRVAERVGCRWYADYAEMLEREELDFAFSFGRHCEMPRIIEALLEAGVPFVTEKPAGVSYEQVRRLAELAKSRGAFAGVALAFRASAWVRELVNLKRSLGEPSYMYFRYVTGPPSRYVEWGCPWMLRRSEAGGGCLINLGVHYVDLAYYLTGREFELRGAAISSKNYSLEVEDYAALVLKSSDGRVAVVEVGYAPSRAVDAYYSVVFERGVATVRKRALRVATEAGVEERELADDHYFRLVKLALDAYRRGEKPPADLGDMARVMRVISDAYKRVARSPS